MATRSAVMVLLWQAQASVAPVGHCEAGDGAELECTPASEYSKLPAPCAGALALAKPLTGCDRLLVKAADPNSIVLVQRGGCPFAVKARHAQAAGYCGAIIVDTSDEEPPMPPSLGEDSGVNISVVMMSQHTGGLLMEKLQAAGDFTLRLLLTFPALTVSRNFRTFLVSPTSQESSQFWHFQFPKPAWGTFLFTVLDRTNLRDQAVLIDLAPGRGEAALYVAQQSTKVFCLHPPSQQNFHMELLASVLANEEKGTIGSEAIVARSLSDSDAGSVLCADHGNGVTLSCFLSQAFHFLQQMKETEAEQTSGKQLYAVMKLELPYYPERNVSFVDVLAHHLSSAKSTLPYLLVDFRWNLTSAAPVEISSVLHQLSSLYTVALYSDDHSSQSSAEFCAFTLPDVIAQRLPSVLLLPPAAPFTAEYSSDFERQTSRSLPSARAAVGQMGDGGGKSSSGEKRAPSPKTDFSAALFPPVEPARSAVVHESAQGSERMKLLVCTAQWGGRNSAHMMRMFEEYNSIGEVWDVTVVLHTDAKLELPSMPHLCGGAVQQVVMAPSAIGDGDPALARERRQRWGQWELMYEHRSTIAANLTRYDLFIFTENDMLLRLDAIRAWLTLAKAVDGTQYLPGFLRIEMEKEAAEKEEEIRRQAHDEWSEASEAEGGACLEDRRYLPDMMTDPTQNQQPLPSRDGLRVAGHDFMTLHNNHQALFVLLPSHVRHLIDRGLFIPNPAAHQNVWGYDVLCSASVAPFDWLSGGYKKIVGLRDLDRLLVHHLPDKYVNKKERRGQFWSVASLQDLYDEHLTNQTE